jgi:hypothetical protein
MTWSTALYSLECTMPAAAGLLPLTENSCIPGSSTDSCTTYSNSTAPRVRTAVSFLWIRDLFQRDETARLSTSESLSWRPRPNPSSEPPRARLSLVGSDSHQRRAASSRPAGRRPPAGPQRRPCPATSLQPRPRADGPGAHVVNCLGGLGTTAPPASGV